MSVSNLKNLSTDELVKQFKEATLIGTPPQELISELKNRPGIAFINATDSAEVTLEKARAAIERVEKGNRQSS
ncbi:hypothetical protein [Aliterella atlantica]|uniref:Uncharacterized protein n=1 Tax=Aliterella atlantica CENA595 TaxID=1618023 RepID=A0A0D8ZQ21_9CYAN|nr:hypothetical protein [Aliterella atlantica]KJH70609.1 hypothetical protein UH38_17015 [Aliterella atlantica CENA595]